MTDLQSQINMQRKQRMGLTETLKAISTVNILGVGIHNVSMQETLDLLQDMILSGEPHHVSPVNPEMVMTARADETFRDVLSRVSLALPDGVGILWGGRVLGQHFSERVTGVDTVFQLAAVACRQRFSLFLLGAAPGVAEKVAEVFQRANPGLQIAGTYAGSPDPQDEDEICRRIQSAKPHIVLVAYSAPKHDLWIARVLPRLKVPLMMSVGGTFDLIAGVKKRAPRWMRDHGLEWLFRLYQEPSRWRRMLALPRFAAAVIQQRFSSNHRSEERGDLRHAG
jgi:N-acetylglucosaminyldiphosphoundecaprenol N-acetyl-beta-D-mannosaminyltransferase